MALFPLGRVVATPAALQLCDEHKVFPSTLVRRHVGGDWGELTHEDIVANIHAVQHDLRVLSAYTVGGVKLYCITEADRSSTCLMIASEY